MILTAQTSLLHRASFLTCSQWQSHFFDTKADLRSGFFTEIISDKRLWDVLRPRRNNNPVESVVRAKELIGKRFALFCSIIVFILKSTAERSSVDYYLAAKAKSRALFEEI